MPPHDLYWSPCAALQGHCRHGDACIFAHGMHELPQQRREAILRDPSAYRGPPGSPGTEVGGASGPL